ncbi:MAG TPA: sensor histidine kinase [Candidatus Dormibacteraeota bacterium]|jgi:signal transduction histidine kinase|nr:sensor histidine kinase [Candidatus Dormibacteraeota bacterium]
MASGVGQLSGYRHLLGQARNPTLLDSLAALILGLIAELVAWAGGGVTNGWIGAIGLAVMTAALSFRRRWPLGAFMIAALALQLPRNPASDPEGPMVLITFVLFSYGVGAFLPTRRARVGFLALIALGTVEALESSTVLANLFFDNLLIAVLPWVSGRMARRKAERERAGREEAERVDAERELHALRAAWGERARIAREIHDVIAHSLSVMVIQAAGARTVMDSDPGRAEDSLRSVERAGREALIEMRRLLGILGQGPASLVPQPGLAELGTLVARTCEAGLETTLEVEGQPAPVPPGLALCAYRIVQEALTNTIKHAGPARATVRVGWRDHELELEVTDDGLDPPPPGAGGHGIAGMRERASLVGGSLAAGPRAGGGFAVQARLPLSSLGS